MSGIAGFLTLDGRPADPALIAQMAAFLAFRGPDAQHIWTGGPAALAHAALFTSPEERNTAQPATLDDRYAITGDVRLDGINELRERLRSAGEHPPAGAADALLALHAYRAWGTECVLRLAGDFSFAVWDRESRTLFCARDPLGIKPFYYALTESVFVFSNLLDGVRLHPSVGADLDELEVAHFLVNTPGRSAEPTLFREIRRLPAAHTLVLRGAKLHVHRYWEPPREMKLRHRRRQDYAAEFKHLLWQAVGERLRCARVSVTMSGGMDSTSVAAIAGQILGPGAVQAYTQGFERIFNDVEPKWARVAAEGMGIPLRYRCLDEIPVLAAYDCETQPKPLPESAPLASANYHLLGDAAEHSPVVLTGEGGDIVLRPATVDDGFNWRHLPAAARHLVRHGRLPQIGLRTAWLQRRRCSADRTLQWLRPELARRVAETSGPFAPEVLPHPTRARAAHILTDSFYGTVFEGYHLHSRRPVEVRHPFFSLGLIEFLFTSPLYSVDLFDKQVLRNAMAGLLPEAVLRRRKTPLPVDPAERSLQAGNWAQACNLRAHKRLWEFVRQDMEWNFAGVSSGAERAERIRLVSLNCWLHALDRRPRAANNAGDRFLQTYAIVRPQTP